MGSPQRLDTHRPDTFRLGALNLRQPDAILDHAPQGKVLRLVIRIFRPALEARVRFAQSHWP